MKIRAIISAILSALGAFLYIKGRRDQHGKNETDALKRYQETRSLIDDAYDPNIHGVDDKRKWLRNFSKR